MPVYAFLISRAGKGNRDKNAFLVSAETVARNLLVYNYISILEMERTGVFLPRIHVNDEERGTRLHIYDMDVGEVQQLTQTFKVQAFGPDSAVRGWLVDAQEHGKLPVNCRKFLAGGENPWRG